MAIEFDDVKPVLKKIAFDTIRSDKDNYFEAVFKKEFLPEVAGKVEGFLGKTLWPGVDKLPGDVENIIDNFGGVMAGQTLYFYKADKYCLFAMLWPWQNKVHITLKFGKVNL